MSFDPKSDRIQKILAAAGVCSRREAEELISSGVVTVNGKKAVPGDRAIPGKDHIKVRGRLIHWATKTIVVAMYKPRDIFSAPRGPNLKGMGGTIWEYLTPIKQKIFPVSKLDKDMEGLELLTNDGAIAERLQRQKTGIPRVYTVKVDGRIEDKKLKRLERGVKVEDRIAKFAEIRCTKELEGKSWFRVTLEAPNTRLVRKLFETVGHPVDKIRKESEAGVSLKGLSRGEFRFLNPTEIDFLKRNAGLLPEK